MTLRKGLIGLVVAAAAVAGLLALRAELMTVEVDQPEGSYTSVVLSARVVQEEPGVVPEMARGLVSTCRLLVNSDVVADSFRTVDEGVFTFRLRPGLDEFDLRELRGCLSDARVQHLQAEVEHMETVVPGRTGR